MGGSFASTFVPLAVGGKYRGRRAVSELSLQGQSAYLALET